MKKLIIFFAVLATGLSFGQASWQGGTNPEANQPATILFDKSSTPLASYSGTIYAHTGVTLNGTNWQNVIGSWGNNTTQPALTLVSGSVYKLDLTPSILQFYGVGSGTVTKVCIVFRNAAGTSQTTDIFLNVGAFQSTLVTPAENSNTIISSGQSLSITANNTNGNANYNLLANGVSINTATTGSYSYTDSNITANKAYELQITQNGTTFSKKFNVIVNPGTVTAALPAGVDDGINYNSSDATRATLVLTAPGKDFVYVAGSFNNWQPGASYAMKKDGASGKFWLELTGLTPGQVYTYQYWVVDTTPFANSPALVKTGDPFSTLVLSPFDDPYIPAASYPNLPAYPAGQEREVTVLQTNQPAYNWQVTNFVKPKKEDLIVEEVLVRDFDANRRYQDLIDRVGYFSNLGINAIELMPVMEYEGNEGWGYNPVYHMALDKFYGPESKLKELVDTYHQHGIAVILDIALNHAFGRCPLVRMWMKDPDGDGWGDPSAENPYFNEFATHTYGVGADFNHSSAFTKNYVKRVVKHWIQDFHIDGFRWDLTKGFTQNCSSTNDACTNSYQQDRVDILKEYVDYCWNLDPTHYAIFEHLGADNEEQQWANYRVGENPSKGVMMWGEMTYAYTQLLEGYSTGADISRMGKDAHGFTANRVIGYPESHDKERIAYSAFVYGNSAGTSPLNNLPNTLARMPAIEATSLLIPGPKMMWHFQELGCNVSTYTCTDGTVNDESGALAGDCKLATKPQPQWANNWLGDPARAEIYNTVNKLAKLKINEPVFEGSYAISPDGSNLRQRIYVYDNNLPSTQLKNVVVIANFSVATQSVNPSFPYTGTWYNLMDNTSMNVTNTTATISLPPGQFRVYGNQLPTLANEQFDTMAAVSLYPNPASEQFAVNATTTDVAVYNLTGQLVRRFGGQPEGYLYNVSDLQAGLYMVRVTNDENQQKTLKFMKE